MSNLSGQKGIVGVLLRIEALVLVNALASIVAIGIAANRVNKLIALLAALAFSISIAVEGFRMTGKHLRASLDASPAAAETQLSVLRDTTALCVLTCAWAAAALLTAYPLAGLNWLHGWQYGVAFALCASGFASYLNRLQRISNHAAAIAVVRRAMRLTAVQTIAVSAALIWVIASGKLATSRGDWLANDVFLASGFAVLALSVLFIARVLAVTR